MGDMGPIGNIEYLWGIWDPMEDMGSHGGYVIPMGYMGSYRGYGVLWVLVGSYGCWGGYGVPMGYGRVL